MADKTFNVGRLLEDNGLKLVGVNEDGSYKVSDQNGNEKTLNAQKMLSDMNLDPKAVNIQVNSPDDALDTSPVGLMDRLKLSVGNRAGSIQYLKSKFEDVQYNPDKGLVVKDQGVWHQVDPSGWGGGDAWQKTKEVAKDLLDLGDVGINASAAAAATAASGVTGGAATIPVMAGAGLLSGKIRTSLGRLAGTYQATPEDELKDIGIEALLNAGGQTIGLGMKPVMSKVTQAVKNFASSASAGAKQAMAAVLTHTADIAPQNAELLMSKAPEIMGELDAVAKTTTPPNLDNALKERAMNYTRGLLSDAGKALGKKFDAAENEMLASVPKTFQANPSEIARQTLDGMVQNGLVKPVVGGESGKIVAYKLADAGRINELLRHSEGSGALNMKALQKLNEFVKMANGLLNSDTKKGADAIESLVNIRRGFDKFYFTATRANPDMKGLLTPISSEMRNNLIQSIKSAGTETANKYASMNELYTKMMPHVAEADRIMKRYGGAETFVNKLMNHNNVGAETLMNTVAALKGEGGAQLANRLKYSVAAQDFVSKMPQIGLKKLATAGAFFMGAHATPAAPIATAVGLAALPATSPRLVGRTAAATQSMASSVLPYARQFGDMLKALPPEQMKQLISDPNMLAQMVRTAGFASAREQQMTDKMLSQAGVK